MTGTATAPRTLRSNDPCWCGSGKKFKRSHHAAEGRVRPGHLSPFRAVPDHIGRPPYADGNGAPRWAEPRVKSADVIERMRRAGRAAAEILAAGGAAVGVGVT